MYTCVCVHMHQVEAANMAILQSGGVQLSSEERAVVDEVRSRHSNPRPHPHPHPDQVGGLETQRRRLLGEEEDERDVHGEDNDERDEAVKASPSPLPSPSPSPQPRRGRRGVWRRRRRRAVA